MEQGNEGDGTGRHGQAQAMAAAYGEEKEGDPDSLFGKIVWMAGESKEARSKKAPLVILGQPLTARMISGFALLKVPLLLIRKSLQQQ